MYAVIETGGKQHRVALGERLRIDLMSDKKKGDTLSFDNVLMIGGEKVTVGSPYVANAKVLATVVDMGKDGEGVKGEKVFAFKKKRRKGFHKTIGHRQRYTEVKIEKIEA